MMRDSEQIIKQVLYECLYRKDDMFDLSVNVHFDVIVHDECRNILNVIILNSYDDEVKFEEVWS